MNSIIKNNLKQLYKLCDKYKVKELYVFGSVCTHEFTKESDIDFLISFKEIPLLEYADNYFDLKEELENLFNRKVDIVEEQTLKNLYFIKVMEKTKTLVYGRHDKKIFA